MHGEQGGDGGYRAFHAGTRYAALLLRLVVLLFRARVQAAQHLTAPLAGLALLAEGTPAKVAVVKSLHMDEPGDAALHAGVAWKGLQRAAWMGQWGRRTCRLTLWKPVSTAPTAMEKGCFSKCAACGLADTNPGGS